MVNFRNFSPQIKHDLMIGVKKTSYLLKCKEKSASNYNEHNRKVKDAVVPRHNNPSIAIKFVSPRKNLPIPIWHDGCVLLYSHGGFLCSQRSRTNTGFRRRENNHHRHWFLCAEVDEQIATGKTPPEITTLVFTLQQSRTKCLRAPNEPQSACSDAPAVKIQNGERR